MPPSFELLDPGSDLALQELRKQQVWPPVAMHETSSCKKEGSAAGKCARDAATERESAGAGKRAREGVGAAGQGAQKAAARAAAPSLGSAAAPAPEKARPRQKRQPVRLSPSSVGTPCLGDGTEEGSTPSRPCVRSVGGVGGWAGGVEEQAVETPPQSQGRQILRHPGEREGENLRDGAARGGSAEEGRQEGGLQRAPCTAPEDAVAPDVGKKPGLVGSTGAGAEGEGAHRGDRECSGAARPKRKRTGAPVLESDEATRDARRLARQKKEHEKRVLQEQLNKQGLCLVEIPADGHCLFSAINDQLKRSPKASDHQHTYKTLRRGAAEYMLQVRRSLLVYQRALS